MLSTFYSWSIEHIKNVFEAKSERDCLQALEDTFSQRLEFTFNGSPLPRVGLQKIVLGMLQTSGFCLNVDWLNAVEVPRDGSNRVSSYPCDPQTLVGSHLALLSLSRRVECSEATTLSGT